MQRRCFFCFIRCQASECPGCVRDHLRCELDRHAVCVSTHVDQSRSGKLANDDGLSQRPAAKVVFHVSRSTLSHATRTIPTAPSTAFIWMRAKSSLSLFLVSGAHRLAAKTPSASLVISLRKARRIQLLRAAAFYRHSQVTHWNKWRQVVCLRSVNC